jgi:hypothetical protein
MSIQVGLSHEPPKREVKQMAITLAFDVYGTLINTHGVLTALEGLVGDRAKAFSNTWRDKQLEYSFRKGLMQNYETFAVCTSQALDYTLRLLWCRFQRWAKEGVDGYLSCLACFC